MDFLAAFFLVMDFLAAFFLVMGFLAAFFLVMDFLAAFFDWLTATTPSTETEDLCLETL